MKLHKYKKYRKYNLVAILFIILIYLFSEEKNDFYYTFSIIIGIYIMIFGSWLSIKINKELNIPVTFMHTINFWIPIIFGIPLIFSLLMKLKF